MHRIGDFKEEWEGKIKLSQRRRWNTKKKLPRKGLYLLLILLHARKMAVVCLAAISISDLVTMTQYSGQIDVTIEIWMNLVK